MSLDIFVICKALSNSYIKVIDLSDAAETFAWVTLRGGNFSDGRRLVLQVSQPNPGWVLAEYKTHDGDTRVAEVRLQLLRRFLEYLGWGHIEPAVDQAIGRWIVHPGRVVELNSHD